jgi:hypothetical protein
LWSAIFASQTVLSFEFQMVIFDTILIHFIG